jgi:small-conductance mechanosensitive channel
MTQDEFDRAATVSLLVFAASVGVLTLAGLVLALMQLAADTATAVAAAAPTGVGISIALKRGK